MSNLPEWIIKFDEINSCCTNISDYKKLCEALAIAWDGIQDSIDEGSSVSEIKIHLKEALRRIRELGETNDPRRTR